MGLLSLKYRRPAKQPIGRSLPDESQEESLDDQSWQTVPSYSSASIPDALTFDKIIEGGTCPVSTASYAPTSTTTDLPCLRSLVRCETL